MAGNTGTFKKRWCFHNKCSIATLKFLEMYIKLPNLKMHIEKSLPKINHSMYSKL